MNRPIYIGIDLGTSGVRAIAIDHDAHTLGESRAPLPPVSEPRPGWHEQWPQDWWRAVLAALDDLPDVLMQQAQAICVDGTSGTLLLTDEQGIPTGPALMYNDQRARIEAQSLARIAPPEAAVHSATSALAKLMWLRRNGQPGRHALHQADWIAFRLGAPLGASDHNNALKLGYDPVHQHWPDWLQATGIDTSQLPRVMAVGEVIGQLPSELGRRWGCREAVTLVAGTTDSNAATLATGIHAVGEAATALGSTLVLKILSERPVYAPDYGIYSHRIRGRWLVGGASNSGGAVLRHFFSDQQLQQLSARIDPLSDAGLDYYPLPSAGERFPINDPQYPPRMHPRPADDAHFLHGLLQGMARIERLGYQRLHQLGTPFPNIIKTTGGGAVNRTWRELRQRIIGVPVEAATHGEAAYGAALIAAGRVTW